MILLLLIFFCSEDGSRKTFLLLQYDLNKSCALLRERERKTLGGGEKEKKNRGFFCHEFRAPQKGEPFSLPYSGQLKALPVCEWGGFANYLAKKKFAVCLLKASLFSSQARLRSRHRKGLFYSFSTRMRQEMASSPQRCVRNLQLIPLRRRTLSSVLCHLPPPAPKKPEPRILLCVPAAAAAAAVTCRRYVRVV